MKNFIFIKYILLVGLLTLSHIATAQSNSNRHMKNKIYNFLDEIKYTIRSNDYSNDQLRQVLHYLSLAQESLNDSNRPQPPTQPERPNPSFNLICMSRDGDNRSPYAIGIQNTLDLSVIKTNIIYTKESDCQSIVKSPFQVKDVVYVCGSRDKDGMSPYSIYTINNNSSTQLKLTYDSVVSCQTSLARSKITPQVLGVCASRDNDGKSPWSFFTINHQTNAVSKIDITYPSLDECQQRSL